MHKEKERQIHSSKTWEYEGSAALEEGWKSQGSYLPRILKITDYENMWDPEIVSSTECFTIFVSGAPRRMRYVTSMEWC